MKNTKKAKHDPFFSKSMEYLPIVQDFFRQHIPPHILDRLGLASLIRMDRKNTDYKLKNRERDLYTRLGYTQHPQRSFVWSMKAPTRVIYL
jgi:hypothetical protein